MQTAMTITMRRHLPCTHLEALTTRQLDLRTATDQSRRRLRAPSFQTSTRIARIPPLDNLLAERPLDTLETLGM